MYTPPLSATAIGTLPHEPPSHRPRTVSFLLARPGQDFPEDIAGGLKLATELSWRSSIRLCILIADAPCHGSMYHSGIGDNYPSGCPKGHNPSKLIYNLQVSD